MLKIVLLCPPGHHLKVTLDISSSSFMLTAYIPANVTGNSSCALFLFAWFYSSGAFVLVFCLVGFRSTGNNFFYAAKAKNQYFYICNLIRLQVLFKEFGEINKFG